MKTTFWYNPPPSNKVPPPPQGATNSFIQVYYMSRVSQSSFFVVYCYINVFPCQNNDKQAVDKNTFSMLSHSWMGPYTTKLGKLAWPIVASCYWSGILKVGFPLRWELPFRYFAWWNTFDVNINFVKETWDCPVIKHIRKVLL